MRKTSLFIGGILLIVIAVLATERYSKPPAPTASTAPSSVPSSVETPTEKKTLIPDLILERYDGQTVRLQSLFGKPMVINVWASWCPFCFKELPDLALAQAEFINQVVMVAINRAEEVAMAKRFTDNLGISNNLVFLLDPQDMFYKAIGGFSMPETIFVDKEGFIREHRRGPVDVNELRRRIQEMLNAS